MRAYAEGEGRTVCPITNKMRQYELQSKAMSNVIFLFT